LEFGLAVVKSNVGSDYSKNNRNGNGHFVGSYNNNNSSNNNNQSNPTTSSKTRFDNNYGPSGKAELSASGCGCGCGWSTVEFQINLCPPNEHKEKKEAEKSQV